MTGIRVDAHEVWDLAIDLDGVPARVAPRVDVAMRRTGFAMEGTAKALAPVDTGALKNSISTTTEGSILGGGLEVEIGPTVNYGGYVELGTSRMSPQPYLAPAFDQHIGPLQDALADAGSEIL